MPGEKGIFRVRIDDMDEVYREIDRRKLDALIEDGVISFESLQNAPIVFVCRCGCSQSIDNDNCERCGQPT